MKLIKVLRLTMNGLARCFRKILNYDFCGKCSLHTWLVLYSGNCSKGGFEILCNIIEIYFKIE